MGEKRHVSRRKFLSGVAVVTAASVLAACAKPTPTPKPVAKPTAKPTSPPPPKEINLVWWVTDRRTINDMTTNEAIPEFQSRNPTIKVKVEFVPSDDMTQKMTAALAAEEAPDVVNVDEQQLEVLFAQNAFHPIPAEVFDVRKEMGDFIADFYTMPWGQPGGKYYALPNGRFAPSIYYNEGLLEANGMTYEDIPTTWDEFIPWAQELTIKEGEEFKQWGFTFLGRGKHIADDRAIQNGLLSFYKNSKETNYGHPIFLEAFQFVLDLFDKYGLETRTGENSRHVFGAGKAVVTVQQSWYNGWMDTKFTNIKWGQLPMITVKGKPPYGHIVPDLGFLVSTQSKDPAVMEASWTLWKYIMSPDYQRRYCRLRGIQPTLLALQGEEEFTEKNPHWRGIALKNKKGGGVDWGFPSAELGDLELEFYGPVLKEGKPLEQEVAANKEKIEKYLAEHPTYTRVTEEQIKAHPDWFGL